MWRVLHDLAIDRLEELALGAIAHETPTDRTSGLSTNEPQTTRGPCNARPLFGGGEGI